MTVIRHGETEWNSVGKQQGHLDSPLTENGRAVNTAEIIVKELGVPLRTDYRLRERHLGIMQGSTIEEYKELHPAEYEMFQTKNPDYVIPDGESARDRYARNWRFFNEIEKTYKGKHLLISGHGGVLDSLIRGVLNIPLSDTRRFSLINGSINRCRFENDKWLITTWGETAHMAGLTFLDDY